MYLLMNEDDVICEFDIDRETNSVINCNKRYGYEKFVKTDVVDFLNSRVNERYFIEKHSKFLEVVKYLSCDMCEKELFAAVTNYTSSYDNLWVKHADNAVDYSRVVKRNNNCKFEYENNTLYVNCAGNSTKANYEHLFWLEGLKLVFILKRRRKLFEDKDNFEVIDEENNHYLYVPKPKCGELDKVYLTREYLPHKILSFSIDDLKVSLTVNKVFREEEYERIIKSFSSLANLYSSSRWTYFDDISKHIRRSDVFNTFSGYFTV